MNFMVSMVETIKGVCRIRSTQMIKKIQSPQDASVLLDEASAFLLGWAILKTIGMFFSLFMVVDVIVALLFMWALYNRKYTEVIVYVVLAYFALVGYQMISLMNAINAMNAVGAHVSTPIAPVIFSIIFGAVAVRALLAMLYLKKNDPSRLKARA